MGSGSRGSTPERARATLKPEIPTRGLHGIPIRDEIVLEKPLGPGPG